MPSTRYIVAAPSDLTAAARSGMQVAALSYQITKEGRLGRALSTTAGFSLMGISDKGLALPIDSVDHLCTDIYYEAKSRQCKGVLLDFERSDPAVYPFLSALCHGLHERGIRHTVPARFHSAAPYAKLLVAAAVSGGSFEDFYRTLAARYGEQRLSFELFPVRADFIIPSIDSDGTPLSAEALAELRERAKGSIFFSRELLTRYFSYQDQDGRTHFVLFDDKATMEEKIRFLSEKKYPDIFILYSDWAALWEPSSR